MKTIPNKSIVIFEMNEVREYEYSGDSYKKPFIDFIESLGFDIVSKYDFNGSVIINGQEFNIDTDNASYMSKNAFTRDSSVRKPINRFVILNKISHTSSTIIKIHFNKEYEADKLRSKIDASIQSRIDREQENLDKKNSDKKNTIAVVNHFSWGDSFKEVVSSVKINKGEIHFDIYHEATLSFKITGKFLILKIHAREIKEASNIEFVLDALSILKYKTKKIIDTVSISEPLSPELLTWAETAYERSYDVTQSKYYEY